LLDQLGDYIDGDLEAKLCAQLEQHLTGCDICRIMVDTTRKTVLLYRREHLRHPLQLLPEISSRLWQALDREGCVSELEE
jgi:predicted anti-sigma-YlaC factor YlaD